MSLTARFLQISPEQLQILINDPSLVESFIYPDEEEDTEEDTEDLDKAWDGIHYLLTGDRWTDEIPKREIPLANVIAGGVEIGDDLDHGPARYMTADQVLAVAEALRDLSRDDLAKRFDVAAFHENGIYPPIWDREEALDYLLNWYDSLRKYYLNAAAKGNAMLKYLF